MTDRDASPQMWGGRFSEPLDPELLTFTSSFDVDRRLLRWDVLASIAHAMALGEARVIPAADVEAAIAGLRALLVDLADGRLVVAGEYEDVHSFLEATLFDRIGTPAWRLHTARSRNDQVATAFRLSVKAQVVRLVTEIQHLMAEIMERATKEIDTVLPGFTHLQHAQPVRLAHQLLAYFWMLDRDTDRLKDVWRRTDVLPLGSGALAGVSFPVDRRRVAALLGFSRISENSIDAVGDRDFAVDAVAAAAVLGIHLSRWAEELVLWATEEFGFVVLADSVATGSSLMPQKKNPDPAELIRGRAGRMMGHLQALLAMLKGLPAGYHRDLQEDKGATFEALDLAAASLRALHIFLGGVRFVPERMEAATRRGWLTATEVADYLVRRGMPFREAHTVAGQVVQRAAAKGAPLWELSYEDYRQLSDLFERDILEAVTINAAVEAKDVPGGTGRRAVAEQLAEARKRLTELARWLAGASTSLQTAETLGR